MSLSVPRPAAKQEIARRTTFVSIALNAVLMSAQVFVGVIAHSQALIADGIHSLADLVSDFVVLVANRQGAAAPDVDHNYGHSRYETVASLFLGGLLIAVGVGMLWRAGERIANLQDIPPVHSSALIVALVVLVSKEALFRYMLRAAERVRSAMLIANAWHARSDAASSLVVALGIIGNMAGFQVLDPIAAAIVGFMVARMGWIFGWDALQDLSDRALDQSTADDLRALVLSTPGVREVHELRTRKMGDLAIVDAHILVDPLISVSEGHYIAESARAYLLTDARVVDALIHVDPENDEVNPPPGQLPMRPVVGQAVRAALGAQGLSFDSMNLHYLSRGFDIDVLLPALANADETAQADARLAQVDFEGLRRRLGAREIRVVRAVRTQGASIRTARGANETAAPR
ncbi:MULTISPECIES: cation diffusion facilitator family transporter [unclassified Caballeronia]|uniref:cation diffusion facilitator family transporter n=1 Tax=unclassified Caballeronia TaxID=2646786 RepID=UPI0028583715|nr:MULTISPECIES: cation diffusion facilitator family transporter [unclassified Caballeronia]MDR5749285.1 cation diffusion facilitator family transporter [Caballeronia sp. LZ024]MDR5843584.1 cation diffusion facilitator family transporter [Caballeronia sp. LZ031]